MLSSNLRIKLEVNLSSFSIIELNSKHILWLWQYWLIPDASETLRVHGMIRTTENWLWLHFECFSSMQIRQKSVVISGWNKQHVLPSIQKPEEAEIRRVSVWKWGIPPDFIFKCQRGPDSQRWGPLLRLCSVTVQNTAVGRCGKASLLLSAVKIVTKKRPPLSLSVYLSLSCSLSHTQTHTLTMRDRFTWFNQWSNNVKTDIIKDKIINCCQ